MNAQTANIIDFIGNLYQFQSVTALAERICNELPLLLGGENTIVCTHDGNRKVITSVVAKHAFSCANLMPHINESGLMAKHPFWNNVFDPNLAVRSISDLTTTRQWHRNALYGEVFAPDGIEDQLNVEILGNTQRFTTVNLLRAKRGFTSEEREIFRLLQSHFTRAFHNASLVQAHGLVDPANERPPTFRVEVNGSVTKSQTEPFKALLRRLSPDLSLNEPLQCWLRDQVKTLNQGLMESNLFPYIHQSPSGTCHFLLYRDFERAPYLLLAREMGNKSSQGQLSPRESEVLHWVAEGKSNEDIAIILNLSPHTVKTHMKRIFKNLGVENRTSAANAWRQSNSAEETSYTI